MVGAEDRVVERVLGIAIVDGRKPRQHVAIIRKDCMIYTDSGAPDAALSVANASTALRTKAASTWPKSDSVSDGGPRHVPLYKLLPCVVAQSWRA